MWDEWLSRKLSGSFGNVCMVEWKTLINSKLKPFIHSSSFILFGTIPTKSGQGFLSHKYSCHFAHNIFANYLHFSQDAAWEKSPDESGGKMKSQITNNKSQINFNDQKRKFQTGRLACFVFWILKIGYYLFFVICFLALKHR